MNIAAIVVTALIALLHFYILVLEMFLWQQPVGLKTFGLTAADAATTARLANNQGLYNGFLAAGLVWAVIHPDPSVGLQLQRFFCGCVFAAGLLGGATVSKRIFFTQSVPAALAVGLGFL